MDEGTLRWSPGFSRSAEPAAARAAAGGRPVPVLQAARPAAPVPGLTAIIIPCCNPLQFTRHGLRAPAQHTRPAWELIVVENGSTDGTADYLAGVADVAPVPVTVVTHAQKLGFPAAINPGLAVARGEFLGLLNHDAVVTRRLRRLTRLMTADPGSPIPEQQQEEASPRPQNSHRSPLLLIGENRRNLRTSRFDPRRIGWDPGRESPGR